MDQALGKVAVYGSLRKGLHNSYLLNNAKPLGTEVITGFKMFSLGSFPFISTKDATDTDSITIEVYEVNQSEFRRLDQLEGFPSFYNRTLVDTTHGKAWIYFIDNYENSVHKPVVHGDWFKEYTGKAAS